MKKVLFILVVVILAVLSCSNNSNNSSNSNNSNSSNNDRKEYSLKGGTVVTTEGDTITIYGGFLYKTCTQKCWYIDGITISK